MRQTLGRHGLLIPLLGGALLLAVAEFLTLYEIKVITAVPEGGSDTAGGHHGYALLIVAIALVPMSIGAVIGGSRPAALAALVLSLVALVVVLAIDLPDVNETGLIGRTYDLAEASPGAGFWVSVACAAVLLVGGLLLLRSRVSAAREQSEARRDRRNAEGNAMLVEPGVGVAMPLAPPPPRR